MNKQRLSPDYLQKLGERLRLIRSILRYDQKDMSDALETAQSQVSKIEAGKAGPTLYQLLRLKRVMEEHPDLRDVPWEWLLDGKGKVTVRG
ncbi:MAG: helix-turn-helix transcriptional regulator [Thermodesulfobacteriota bacterium]|nr:helix-turn-helix transcriptional regulator [Thermodesulfobacteriota bacterium]